MVVQYVNDADPDGRGPCTVDRCSFVFDFVPNIPNS